MRTGKAIVGVARLLMAAVSMFWLAGSGVVLAAEASVPKSYVGTEACRECHEPQFRNYMAFSKKAHSFRGIKQMKKGLTESELRECYECHTTGFGQPGGFVSEETTPKMKDAGCEVCHGPGGAHVKSQSASDIKRQQNIKDCERCHNPDRVKAFNFKPLLFGGAH